MKNRNNNFHELREQMDRFNVWERSYIQKLSGAERFSQFIELFDLGMSADRATAEKAHREHIEQLARISRAAHKQNR